VPAIVNTDQGSQFTAEEFTQAVLASGCKLSMDGRGAWRDNVPSGLSVCLLLQSRQLVQLWFVRELSLLRSNS
jgi:hypothetical protein